MPYLEKDDYTIAIAIDHLDDVLTAAIESSGKSADTVRADAEATAQAQITAFVSSRYDIDTEFAIVAPNARSRMVIKCVVDIALYHLHMTINPRNIPAIRQLNFDGCMDYLAGVREGKMALPNVALLPDASRVDATTMLSQRKFISKAFTDRSILDGDTL